jgi:hypothetical protein
MLSSTPVCNLPPLPAPVVLGGMPDGDRYVLTQSGLAELARYLVGVRQWIESATACLSVQESQSQ